MSISAQATFFVPQMSGKTGDVWSFFQRKTADGTEIVLPVIIDNTFQEFIDALGPTYVIDKVMRCFVYQTKSAKSVDKHYDDDEIINLLSIKGAVDANKVCGILKYLGENQFYMPIPEGQKKISIIIGYAAVDDERLVFFLEHELKKNVEEVHLCARPFDRWGDDSPMIILTK